MRSIYRVNTVMAQLPSVVKELNYLLVPKAFAHDAPYTPAPAQEVVYELDDSKISSLLQESQGFDDFVHHVRIDVLKFLVDTGYTAFNDQPYQKD